MLAMMIAAGTIAPIATACDRSRPAAVSSRPLEKVTHLTTYGTAAREEYGQVAKSRNNFRDVGLDVTIIGGQPSNANIQSLLGGRAQFAAIDFVSAGRGFAAAKGQYRVLAAIQHTTLLSMISLTGMGVTEPADLIGKTVGTAAQAAAQTLYPTYARLAGYNGSTTRFRNADTALLPGLLAQGKVSAIGGFSIDVPTIRQAAGGREPVVLPYSRYINDLYGTVIITTSQLADSRPDLVRDFVSALMQGTRYAVDHPAEAGKIIHAAVVADDADAAAETMTLMRPYVDTGALDEARVARALTVLEDATLVPAGSLQPDQLVRFDLGPRPAPTTTH
jgi:NitT/TauT family transport system substrate-binding protein